MILRKLRAAYDNQVDGTGLAIFRIAYSLVLLAEVIQLYYFRHLVYDIVPYVQPASFDRTLLLQLWIVVILLITAGCFARIAKLLNYLFTLYFLPHLIESSSEYHMFFTYIGMNFLLMFLPVERCLSIDRLFEKLKYSHPPTVHQPAATVSRLCYFFPLLYIGLQYFDSVIFKLTSPMWLEGLGLWLPATLAVATHINASWVLNQEVLVRMLGFATIVFEAVFVFLFWFKPFRWPLFLLGFLLHVGILLEFPIPWFALGILSVELLLIPNSFWKKISPRRSAAALTFYYDEECPLCQKTKIAIEHFDWLGGVRFQSQQSGAAQHEPALAGISPETIRHDAVSVDRRGRVYSGSDTYIQTFNAMGYLKPLSWMMLLPGCYQLSKLFFTIVKKRRRHRSNEKTYATPPLLHRANSRRHSQHAGLMKFKVAAAMAGIALIIFLQFVVIYDSNIFKSRRVGRSFDDTRLGATIKDMAVYGMGITGHPVFMDSHFNEYNHIIAVTHEDRHGHESFLPMVRENGMPGWYAYGFNWVRWTFRANNPIIQQERLKLGLRDFTAFWAHKNRLALDDLTFQIKVKKIEPTRGWRYNYLNTQLQQPWIDAGEARWNAGQFQVRIAEIEKM